jgi:outer membrane beta-barrel protein
LASRGPAAALTLLGLFLSSSALAAEPEAVVVRNRLYSDSGRFELQLNYSFGVANTLTATQGPVLDLAYHFHEAWAIDLLVGYMFGGPTDLLGQAQCPGAGSGTPCTASVFTGASASQPPTEKLNDFPNLWTLNGLDAQIGVRWEPVYGKLSLFTAVPVHFKWYLGIDGGAAQFSRDSFDFCTTALTQVGEDCPKTNGTYNTLQETRWSWVGSAATGLRLIFAHQASINLGLREYVWGDSYRSGFTVLQFSPNPSSSINTKSGITPSLFADLGLSWTF